MSSPLYERTTGRLDADGHLGLFYTRFFDRYGTGWDVESSDAKRSWIASAVRSADERANSEKWKRWLRDLSIRRVELVRACGGELMERRTCWHFVTGLGLPHPVENGFAWHPTLGLPFLPATGVKGLLAAWLYAHYSDPGIEASARDLAHRRHRQWCGVQDDAGDLIFFDAIPAKPPELIADVMTPHYGRWYAEGGEIGNVDAEPQKIPADWHSPVPVPFLAVKRGTFLFAAAPRPGVDWAGRDPKAEVAAALEELSAALSTLGAGAKTAVGYGRFDAARSHYATLQERERKIADKNRRASQMTHFKGFDPPVEKFLQHTPPIGWATLILNKIEKRECEWADEDRRKLALRLKEWLIGRNEWITEPSKKKRISKKERNTQRVQVWLGER